MGAMIPAGFRVAVIFLVKFSLPAAACPRYRNVPGADAGRSGSGAAPAAGLPA
jgi:hypothetical protein